MSDISLPHPYAVHNAIQNGFALPTGMTVQVTHPRYSEETVRCTIHLYGTPVATLSETDDDDGYSPVALRLVAPNPSFEAYLRELLVLMEEDNRARFDAERARRDAQDAQERAARVSAAEAAMARFKAS